MTSNSDDQDKNSMTDGRGGITRRDFVGTTLLGSGAALLSAGAPIAVMATGTSGQQTFRMGNSIPLPLTGLDKSWTGYGGGGRGLCRLHRGLYLFQGKTRRQNFDSGQPRHVWG